MKYRVLKKQHNSKKCIVCGMENNLGLKASFYEIENNEVVAIFKSLEEHQSYPGRLHGGIASAILDETIGRAIMIKDPNMWGVTIELNLKYKKPVPLNEELKVVGRIIKDTRRVFEGTGEILLSNGEVAVTAQGKYFKMPVDKITDSEFQEDEWKIIASSKDPKEIDI
ncbi:PaaI family thioesterase [Clostridium sp. PL3]|uniref:PaaI family thioesterase n=1 Tax=Clostridium thailandense TaxID=2794346 RepID=A0A949TW23_9CLOT|nr:PaaI family thioesterase [Clostridium thailandense]MBV7272515.1 PaaI family thioesterase [Clostridium thailandense]